MILLSIFTLSRSQDCFSVVRVSMTSVLSVCCCARRFLGHLYAAEALISLDRISDAIAHLNPENVTDVSLGVSPSEQDQGASLSCTRVPLPQR